MNQRPLISSVRAVKRGGHQHIDVFVRGALAGTLTVSDDECEPLCALLADGERLMGEVAELRAQLARADELLTLHVQPALTEAQHIVQVASHGEPFALETYEETKRLGEAD
jgi:hypothetical protein